MHNQINLAVFGRPISHSLSPHIFHLFFQQENIKANYIRISENKPQNVINIFSNLALLGANLTSPLKRSILPFLPQLSPEVQIIGAANLIYRDEKNNIRGENTDWIGVYNILTKYMRRERLLQAKKALVIGAGGAAHGAIYALQKLGLQIQISVINRTNEKAQILAKKFNIRPFDWNDLEHCLDQHDIILSTLPDSSVIQSLVSLKPQHILIDANYKTSNQLTKMGLNDNSIIIDGKIWLWEQALASFEYIFKRKLGPMFFSENLFHQKNLSLQEKEINFITWPKLKEKLRPLFPQKNANYNYTCDSNIISIGIQPLTNPMQIQIQKQDHLYIHLESEDSDLQDLLRTLTLETS